MQQKVTGGPGTTEGKRLVAAESKMESAAFVLRWFRVQFVAAT
jgi:hypothetical protein